MKIVKSLNPEQLSDYLLGVAVVSPVFIWGPPGIGKSSLVNQFAASVGLPCVSLLGSQLASEDLIGVPKIEGDVSKFCPPEMIARKDPYCLFLDELNASSVDVQKAFYSLVLEKRVGSYTLPAGSIVIGAGNRLEDGAIVRPMPSALINRFSHVQLTPDAGQWIRWARSMTLREDVINYIETRPDHLWELPPKEEAPFATPRSWHTLSVELDSIGDSAQPWLAEACIRGRLSEVRASSFMAWRKMSGDKFKIDKILKGEARWPEKVEDRDSLYFLAQSLRAKLIKGLPVEESGLSADSKTLSVSAKNVLISLSRISGEIAQSVISEGSDGKAPPTWFLVEVARDLPKLGV